MKNNVWYPTACAACLVICLGSATTSSGEPSHEFPPYVGSPGLEAVKTLAGRWTGTVAHVGTDHGDAPNEVHASYEVTSNGSAVIERIFIGTPMEMTSVYYDRGGNLAMTHYCAIANRPTLTLKQQQEKDVLEFAYADGEDLDPRKDMHIHGLTLRVMAEGEIVQEWQGYEGGEPTHKTVLSLKRDDD